MGEKHNVFGKILLVWMAKFRRAVSLGVVSSSMSPTERQVKALPSSHLFQYPSF